MRGWSARSPSLVRVPCRYAATPLSTHLFISYLTSHIQTTYLQTLVSRPRPEYSKLNGTCLPCFFESDKASDIALRFGVVNVGVDHKILEMPEASPVSSSSASGGCPLLTFTVRYPIDAVLLPLQATVQRRRPHRSRGPPHPHAVSDRYETISPISLRNAYVYK